MSESLRPLQKKKKDCDDRNRASVVIIKGCLNASYTDLTASVPEGDWVVVGGVGPGACWVDATQLLHVVADEGVSCIM